MIPTNWLNLCGEPVIRSRITRTLHDAGRAVIEETNPAALVALSTLEAVVIDHNTTKAMTLFAGAYRESGLLVVYVGANRGNRDELNYAAGMLGFFRVEAHEFGAYFGKNGRFRLDPVDSSKALSSAF